MVSWKRTYENILKNDFFKKLVIYSKLLGSSKTTVQGFHTLSMVKFTQESLEFNKKKKLPKNLLVHRDDKTNQTLDGSSK